MKKLIQELLRCSNHAVHQPQCIDCLSTSFSSAVRAATHLDRVSKNKTKQIAALQKQVSEMKALLQEAWASLAIRTATESPFMPRLKSTLKQ